MLQQAKTDCNTTLYLEPVEDITQAYIVYYNDIYVGQVFKSIAFPRWLTSGDDDTRYLNPEIAAQNLLIDWERRQALRQQESLPF
jgi:hypothetical protein